MINAVFAECVSFSQMIWKCFFVMLSDDFNTKVLFLENRLQTRDLIEEFLISRMNEDLVWDSAVWKFVYKNSKMFLKTFLTVLNIKAFYTLNM